MTDVPADNGAPGAPPVQPWDPSGIRRSNFTPPPPGAEPPTFDDDALADAMAAEVSPYTSEIKLPHLLPPEGAEFGGPPPGGNDSPAPLLAAAVIEPEPEPVVDAPVVAPIPLIEPARFLGSGLTADTSPMTSAAGAIASASETSSQEEELRRALGGASTLEAIQRLEDEFRRISNGEAPSIEVPVATGESATVLAESAPPPADTDVFSWLSAATVAPIPADVAVTPIADLSGADSPASDGPSSDTVALDTVVPGAAVPDTLVPDTVVPDGPIPDAPAPSSPPFDLAAPEPVESAAAVPDVVEREVEPVVLPAAASVFDIPDLATPISATEGVGQAEGAEQTDIADPADVAEPTGVADPTGVAEPTDIAEQPPFAEPLVDPLDALAFGGAWALPSADESPLAERVSHEPLPGTDALGWNTSAPSDTEPALAEADAVESEEDSAPPAPLAPLAATLGTEVWSLFPDDDPVDQVPTPEQSVFDLPTPDTASPDALATAHAEPASQAAVPEMPAAFAWMFPASTADVAPIDEPSYPFGEPSPDDAHAGPVAFESLATATAAIPIVTALSASEAEPALEPEQTLEPELTPEPEPMSSGFAALPPVDESLIDPDAAAAAAAATLGASIPPPLPTPAPVEPEPWMAAEADDDGVWDLGAEPASAPPPASPPAFPNPGVAAAAAAAALVAAAPTLPPVGAPVPPSTTGPLSLDFGDVPADTPPPTAWPTAAGIEPVPAPVPTVLPPDLGPHYAVAVPYSTEPPVGPESPDWLDAPPPNYSPPELVEPPQFVDSVANPALDPVSPITANTMARLPVPLPSELPNIADRAELPPPPGYEDIPIMSIDAAAQSTTFAPPVFAPAMFGPVVSNTVAAEPLLPVPPSAPPITENSVSAPAGELAEPEYDDLPEATESTSLDDEDDDAIDEVDRVGAAMVPVSAVGAAQMMVAEPVAPPSEPIATARLDDGQPAIVDQKPKLSATEVERAGVEPTALDLRTGRAARLFWLWFAANSSVVSLGLGAVLLGTGMSLRQSIVATLAGVAISFLPLGLGTLAGKWSGQPTMVVSRAAFGHAGNILPAALAVITRVFWGGVLLWLLATAVAQLLVGAGLDAGLGTQIWQLVGLVVGFVIATVVAVFGYGFIARLQLVLSIVNGLLIVGAAALTFQRLDFAKALTLPDGSWVLAVGGAAIVFSVIGLAWVHSSSDLARYQKPGGSGGATMLWANFGATLPPFLLICWGAMLAASDPALASALQTNPLAAIASLLPAWYPAPLLAAASLGLLSGAVLTIYSGGFALQALGLTLRRSMTTLLSAVLVVAAAAALLFLVPDFSAVVRSVIITIAVPVAAWAGIFAAEMMIRTRRFHTPSLLAPGGIYPQVRWLNLVALVVISAVSYGFVTSNVVGFQWEGFLFTAMGVAPSDPFGASNVGVFVALLLGILVPLAGGIPTIRRQEATGPGVHTGPGAHTEAATPSAIASPVVSTAPVVTAAPGPFTTPVPQPSDGPSDSKGVGPLDAPFTGPARS